MAQPPSPSSEPQPGGSRPRGATSLTGRTVARCTVGERVGRGATSTVYRARHGTLQKDVALKVLWLDTPDAAEMQERYREEAKAIAKLDHGNIVKVFDVVEDKVEGRPCLCILMELVQGGTLQDRLDDQKTIPPKKAAEYCAQVARALEAAHAAGIVHRDIKPANMMLAKGDVVKVVDFGLASKGATNRVGTPLYMSPEAAQGKRIDEKSDVYALGVSLYQCMTGKHPFTGGTVKEILQAQVSGELVPVSRVKPDVGTKYDALLAKLLVKSKGYRPSAAEAAELLEELLDVPQAAVGAGGGGGGARRGGGRRPGKKGGAAGIVAGLFVVALVVVGFLVMTKNKEEVEGGGQAPGAGTPGGVPSAPLTPVAPVDPNAVAAKAFEDAEAFARESRDPEAVAKKWRETERAAAGTPVAAKVAEKLKAADEAAARVKADREREAREKADRERLVKENATKHEEIRGFLVKRDFTGAASRAKNLGTPEGMEAREWLKKAARIEFLGKEFVPAMDTYFRSTNFEAPRIDPSAAPDEVITGAERNGLTTNKNRTLPWEKFSADDLFHKVAKRAISQRSPEGCLFLAILAAELGDTQQEKAFRETVGLVDAAGTVTPRLREYFTID